MNFYECLSKAMGFQFSPFIVQKLLLERFREGNVSNKAMSFWKQKLLQDGVTEDQYELLKKLLIKQFLINHQDDLSYCYSKDLFLQMWSDMMDCNINNGTFVPSSKGTYSKDIKKKNITINYDPRDRTFSTEEIQ